VRVSLNTTEPWVSDLGSHCAKRRPLSVASTPTHTRYARPYKRHASRKHHRPRRPDFEWYGRVAVHVCTDGPRSQLLCAVRVRDFFGPQAQRARTCKHVVCQHVALSLWARWCPSYSASEAFPALLLFIPVFAIGCSPLTQAIIAP
jgi:hypothetical protein